MYKCSFEGEEDDFLAQLSGAIEDAHKAAQAIKTRLEPRLILVRSAVLNTIT